jgi:hypothetical protein
MMMAMVLQYNYQRENELKKLYDMHCTLLAADVARGHLYEYKRISQRHADRGAFFRSITIFTRKYLSSFSAAAAGCQNMTVTWKSWVQRLLYVLCKANDR